MSLSWILHCLMTYPKPRASHNSKRKASLSSTPQEQDRQSDTPITAMCSTKLPADVLCHFEDPSEAMCCNNTAPQYPRVGNLQAAEMYSLALEVGSREAMVLRCLEGAPFCLEESVFQKEIRILCSHVTDKKGASRSLCALRSLPGHWFTHEDRGCLRSLLPTSTPRGALDELPPSLYRNLVP